MGRSSTCCEWSTVVAIHLKTKLCHNISNISALYKSYFQAPWRQRCQSLQSCCSRAQEKRDLANPQTDSRSASSNGCGLEPRNQALSDLNFRKCRFRNYLEMIEFRYPQRHAEVWFLSGFPTGRGETTSSISVQKNFISCIICVSFRRKSYAKK